MTIFRLFSKCITVNKEKLNFYRLGNTRLSSLFSLTTTAALVPTRRRGNRIQTHPRLVDLEGRQRVPKAKREITRCQAKQT